MTVAFVPAGDCNGSISLFSRSGTRTAITARAAIAAARAITPSLYVEKHLHRGLAARAIDGSEPIGQAVACRNHRQDAHLASVERLQGAIERAAPRAYDRHLVNDDRRPRHRLFAGN